MSLRALQQINESSPEQSTVDLLLQLQQSIATSSNDQLDDLRVAVEQKQSELAGKAPAGINRELENLRLRVREANPTIVDQAADFGNVALVKANEALDASVEHGKKTIENVQKLTLKEYTEHLGNPNKPVVDKIIRYGGFALMGYGAYRLSRWFLSSSSQEQPKTFMGSVASKGWWLTKALGLTWLASLIVNRVAESSSPQKKAPAASASATRPSVQPVTQSTSVQPVSQPVAPNNASATPNAIQNFLQAPVALAGKSVQLEKVNSGINVVIDGNAYNLKYSFLVNSFLSSGLQSAELQPDGSAYITTSTGSIMRVEKNDLEAAVSAIVAGNDTVKVSTYDDKNKKKDYEFQVKKV